MKRNHKKQTTQLWYAVDENGVGYFFSEKPERDCTTWWNENSLVYELNELFIHPENLPNITWQDEPVLVKFVTNIYF